MPSDQETMDDKLPGISAVLAANAGPADLDGAVLDMAAVLDGLVNGNFEIIVVEAAPSPLGTDTVTGLRARYPSLPVRLYDGEQVGPEAALAAGFDAATYDLILVAGTNGEFDVRETNHLLDAIENGADLAIGYRRRRADGIVRRLYGWGWNALVSLMFGKIGRDVDCSFKLFRTAVWQGVGAHLRAASRTFNTELLVRARRMGFRVAEVPVSHHRPPGAAQRRPARLSEIRRALVELGELRRGLEKEKGHSAAVSLPAGPQAA
jgi:hypothetical protein